MSQITDARPTVLSCFGADIQGVRVMDYVGERNVIHSPVLSFPRRVGHALSSGAARAARWVVSAGHKDRPCGRCGTLVRAGQRQCVLCSYNFDI